MGSQQIQTAVSNLTTAVNLDQSYEMELAKQLLRIKQAGLNQVKKRISTIRAMCAAEGRHDQNRTSVFERDDTISRNVYYDKNKDWHHGADFVAILDDCLTLASQYYHLKSLRHDEAERQRLKQQEMEVKDRLFQKASDIMDLPLVERSFDTENGHVVIKPMTGVNPQAAATVAKVASELGRRALDMTQEKTASELTGKDGAPVVDMTAVVAGYLAAKKKKQQEEGERGDGQA